MGKRPTKTTTGKSAAQVSKFLDSITGSDALAILKLLAERDEKLVDVIDATARELLGRVDVEDVAADVQMELEFLDVEEVWDRSGATGSGYVDPGDAAWQMFEDALDPFKEEMEKYKKLSMFAQARSLCEGILKGIYDFQWDSSTEYRGWAEDAPGDFFGQVLDDWKSLFEGEPPLLEMENFLNAYCPEWAEWARHRLSRR